MVRSATFAEATADLGEPARWGHGQHIFAPISTEASSTRGSANELAGPARSGRVQVVTMDYPIPQHRVAGGAGIADPVAFLDRDSSTGAVTRVRYEYPAHPIKPPRDLEPLLSRHRVQLVLNGHTHMRGRFRNAAGVNFLETSNVGSTFGAYPVGGAASRYLPGPVDGWHEAYVRQGDAGGLEPLAPSLAPELGPDGTPLPYLASDTVTAFSLLDPDVGVVRAYRFDTAGPDAVLVLFDEFTLD